MTDISVLKKSRVDVCGSECLYPSILLGVCCIQQRKGNLFKIDYNKNIVCNINTVRYICGKLQDMKKYFLNVAEENKITGDV